MKPLNNLLKTMDKEGQKVAAAMYNSSGTVTHHNTDMWGDSAPQDNYMPATFWPMGATWMITHVIEHYRFTGDKDMLRDMFPTLRAVAQFALDFLTEHKGYMVTNPSLSPENTFLVPGGGSGQSAAVAAGPTIDNQLLWEVFGFIPEAQAALGIKDEGFAKRVSDMRAKLPPLRLNQYGGVAEWMEDFEEVCTLRVLSAVWLRICTKPKNHPSRPTQAMAMCHTWCPFSPSATSHRPTRRSSTPPLPVSSTV